MYHTFCSLTGRFRAGTSAVAGFDPQGDSFASMAHARFAAGKFRLALLRACLAGVVLAAVHGHVSAQETASGVVFIDTNKNQQLDAGEKPLKSVAVSNGQEVVLTDEQGRYSLPVGTDTTIFVIKPGGYRTVRDENGISRFYYTHKPGGSPTTLKYPGVAPTGPLPSSINFPLYQETEPAAFDVLFFGDPQPRTQQEIDYMSHDIIEDLIGSDAAFGVSLGDILFDDLSLFDSINRTFGTIGIPWYNVIGNHDINYAADDDELSDETFERVYGPPYYSFNYGAVHFIAIDDIHWIRDGEKKFYRSGLSDRQLKFIENDLAHVDQKQLVVVMMHIPLVRSTPWLEPKRERLFRILESRERCISIAGHTHHHEHTMIGDADGWKGSRPHHHMINVTACGSWWSGKPDEEGIPHTMCADGTPNGYSIMHFDGTNYVLEYRAARRPAEYQMRITAPEVVAASDTAATVFQANIFNAMPGATVEWRLNDDSAWQRMEKDASPDPVFQILSQEEIRIGDAALTWRKLPKPMTCPHLWKSALGANVPRGTHVIHVRATQSNGQTFTGNRVIRVE